MTDQPASLTSGNADSPGFGLLTPPPTERVVSWFSHGACSAIATKMTLAKHGPDVVIACFGYAMNKRDHDRAINFDANNPGVRTSFPLIERRLYKSHCLALIERAGIVLPEMYRLGYVNNNCIGCWKAGKGYWNKIREDFPETFAEAAAAEREIGHSGINGTFLDELVPGTGRYKPEEVSCDLNCQTVEDDWTPVTIGVAS